MRGPRLPPMLALVGVTAIWGYTFVPVQKAVAVYPLFAFLAVRFAISTLVLAPFAWRSLWRLPRRGLAAGAVAGALLAAAYGLQTAGLDRTTVASTGFITGLYVVLTPLLALAPLPHARRGRRVGGRGTRGRRAADAERHSRRVGARERARARERRRAVVPDRGDGAVRAPLRRAGAHLPADGGRVCGLHRDRSLAR